MYNKSILTACLLMLSLSATAHAVVTISSNKNASTETTTKQQIKKDIDDKFSAARAITTSRGSKTGDTDSNGFDDSTSFSSKDSASKSHGGATEISVSLDQIFASKIMEMEDNGTGIFGQCKLFSNPPTPADLGLTAEFRPGVIDTIKASFLRETAASNTPIDQVIDPRDVHIQINCMARYGAFIS